MAQLGRGELFANRFEIEHTAGVGGMGVVYRALDRLSGKVVALKILNSRRGEHNEGERFNREVQLLSELRHPGIVSYIGHGQTLQGERFLAMEWLEGVDLSQRLKRGPLSLADSYLLISCIADALDLAHQRSIVHRDINPRNLFLPDDDIARVKLLDFGIARRTAIGHSITSTGLVIGTPEYMAPEQVRGLRDLTPAADIFALGSVLYRCLAGESAFSAAETAALLVRILFEEPVPINKKHPEIPDSVAQLLRRMLHKDPAQRIANAGELLLALAQLGELPSISQSVVSASSVPASGFARNEQSLCSLVMASMPPAGDSMEVPAIAPESSCEVPRDRELVSELRTLGVRPDFLVGGLLVVTVPESGSANDQVSVAARVALRVKERWPLAVVAVATGRGEAQGDSTVGEVVDRATRLLQQHSAQQHSAQQHSTAPADEAAAAPAGVFLDPLSARLLSTRFIVSALAGSADGTPLLLGEHKDDDASRPLLGKPTPCVGRDAELGMLEVQLRGCIEDSEARAIIVTAPPGIGKSRLRHEFLRRIEKLETKPAVWLGRGDPMRTSSAYCLLAEAISRLCGFDGSEPNEVAQRKLCARVSQHLGALDPAEKERVILFVAELCGIPFPEEGNPMLSAARHDPKIMGERISHAFLSWLTAECRVAPVLLIIDDLQWSDALSIALIDEALSELKLAPLCVLAFARPEVQKTLPKLWPSHKLQEIQLKALGRKPCERLIQHLLGKQLEPALMARIVEQSAGNALFLEELIRAVAEGKSDSQADTVLAMLQARLGRFEPGTRRALRAAAIFGQTFWRGGVAMVLGVQKTAPELANWLANLVHAEVIEAHGSTHLLDEKEYGFRHGLVRDAAYELLTEEDRQTGHRLAAEFLEAADARGATVIAEHYELGRDAARAAHFHARAAEQSLSNSDSRSALRHVERGLSCGAQGDTLAILRSVELAAWRRLNRFDRLYELLPVALPVLRQGTRAFFRAHSVAVLAAALGPPAWRAKVPELITMLLGAAPEPDARVAYAEALAFMAVALAAVTPKSQVQPILSRLHAVVELQAQANPTFRRWYLWPAYYNAYYREPKPFSSFLGCEEGISHARVAGDRLIQLSLSIAPKALHRFEMGDVQGALRLLRDTAKEAVLVDGFVSELTRQNLARVLCEADEEDSLDEAVGLSQAAIDKPNGASMFIGMAHHNLACVKLKRNQQAVIEAEQAYKVLEASPLLCVDAAATLVLALLAERSPAQALPLSEKALSVIEAFGGAGFAEVKMRLAASEAFHAAGNAERARAELHGTLRQITLRGQDITDPVWRDSYLTRNPSCVRAHKLAAEWGVAYSQSR